MIGLLGFPTVLRAMAANMDWVEDAGDAVLENLAGVQQSVAAGPCRVLCRRRPEERRQAERDRRGRLHSHRAGGSRGDLSAVLRFAVLVEAIRAGDASLAAQPAPTDRGTPAKSADSAAQAEAAAQAAKDAAASSQQAAAQAQAAAEQSASSASQAAASRRGRRRNRPSLPQRPSSSRRPRPTRRRLRPTPLRSPTPLQ